MARLRSALLVLCSALLLPALSLDCGSLTDGQNLGLLELEEGAEMDLVDLMDMVNPANYKNNRSCLAACCKHPDCDLVRVGPSSCEMVNCQRRRGNNCVLRTGAEGRQVYRKGKAVVRTDQDQGRIKVSPLLLPLKPLPRKTGNKESEEKWSVHCRLPQKVGLCRAAFPKYSYDPVSQTCQRFTYGGCGGNKNNFVSKQECEQKCAGVTGPVLPDESTPAPSFPVKPDDQLPAKSVVKPSAPGSASSGRTAQCLASPDPGPCRAAFPKFYYNPDTSTCQRFIYGGCRGNKNRYDTEEECLELCGNGEFDSHGKTRDRWTAGVFLFISLAAISALLLGALIITTLRRHRLPHRPSSISDKEELLPDDSSSVDSLSMPAPH